MPKSDEWMLPCDPVDRRGFLKFASNMLGTIAVVGAPGTATVFPGPAGTEEKVTYAVGARAWPQLYGNHRAVFRVRQKADAVWVRIPWRRKDASPGEKDVLIVDYATGQRVANVVRINVQDEFGDFVLQPKTVPGLYHAYYMPYALNDRDISNYKVSYLPPQATASPDWIRQNGLTPDRFPARPWEALPRARASRIEARTDFDRFDPMEVPATREETSDLLAKHSGASALLFPEVRQHPIRMTDHLPLRWVEDGPSAEFHGVARRGEFYVFQIGLYAAREAISDVSVKFSDLRPAAGAAIPAAEFRCFNLGGVDWMGRQVKKGLSIAQGKIQALWFGIKIPRGAPTGVHQATLTLFANGAKVAAVQLSLKVSAETADDCGDDESWRLSRLRWLDSTVGLSDNVIAPFTSLKVRGSSVQCLGREVVFGNTGLPAGIRSGGKEILARPVEFVVETAGGAPHWAGGKTETVKAAPGVVIRETVSRAGSWSLRCRARMEFDGHISFRLGLKTSAAAHVSDIRLEVPLRRAIATYMMGLAHKGGYRQKDWKWVWHKTAAQNSVWVGEADAGLQCKLKGTEDVWGMDLKPSEIPQSWCNQGKGGCDVVEEGGEVVIRAYSGERDLGAGDELEFCFALLITPFKPLDGRHWRLRHSETGYTLSSVDAVARAGASVYTIHHAVEPNPYINYPFLTADKIDAFVSEAHERDLKILLYYTVRELSNRAPELWAFRSLGTEIYQDGPGGGDPWLQEHLGSGYAPAWRQPLPNGDVDAAIQTTGLSRFHNYYLEGLAWLLKNVRIDGIYLDGIGYDREIMKRVRRILDECRPGSLIDFHAGNDFVDPSRKISPANYYMEHFPYLNSLWFGELFDYNESPDYWLVEVSGIPFGLFSEMLQDGGNPWRGMIYGMTGRLFYNSADPRSMWKVWDEFGIETAKMIGYWDPSCPVKTDQPGVLATVYCKQGKALISLASWAKETVRCRLSLDWKSLDLHAEKTRLRAPAIPTFQEGAVFATSDDIPVDPGRGRVLILEEV